MSTDPLVIVAAVNGGMQMDRDGARVPTSPEQIAEDARLCAEAGAAIVHVHARDGSGRNTVEYEIVDTHALHRLSRYADDGLFDREAGYIWLLYGGGLCFIPPDPEYLVFLRQQGLSLFPNARWVVIGAGRGNFTWATLGISMGCTTARVGFEAGVYLPDGRVAERNHQLVGELVRIAAIFGRRPATPEEARGIMSLDRA